MRNKSARTYTRLPPLAPLLSNNRQPVNFTARITAVRRTTSRRTDPTNAEYWYSTYMHYQYQYLCDHIPVM